MRKLLGILVVTAVVVGAPAVAAAEATVPPGVSIGGVAVGGMSRSAAVAAVRSAYLDGSVRITVASRPFRFGVFRLGLRISLRDAIDAAMIATGPGDYPITVRFSDANVARYAAHISDSTDIPARDAAWHFHGRLPRVVHEKSGRRARRSAVAAAIVAQLRDPSLRAAGSGVPRSTVSPRVRATRLGPALVIVRGANLLRYYEYRSRRVQRLRTFGVATGRPAFPTPAGTFTIVTRQRNPWWYPPDSPWAEGLDPIPPGPGNPLGTRWMGLSAAGIGIHGTPDAASIGYSASHGCIRMRIPDAEWLFVHVRVGTPVKIL